MTASISVPVRRTTAIMRRLSAAVLVAIATLSLAACDLLVNADKRVQRADAHMAKGEYRPAMAQLKTALEDEPDHAGARLALAELSYWLGDVKGAALELERALSAGAAEGQARPLQYQLLLAQNRFDDLAALLDKDTVSTPVRRLVIEAQAAKRRGELLEAENKVKAALAAAPDDPEALLEAARLASAQGDGQDGLQLPERVSADPLVYARALHLRGTILMHRGEFDRAREAFAAAEKAGRLLPVPEQLAIATAYTEANLALNDVPGAEDALRYVSKWGAQTLVVHYLRARTAMLKQDWVAAVAECQRALRIAPEHAQSQILLAAAHLAQGSLEQAQNALTRVLSANPDNRAARKLLGQVYLTRNQPQQARQVLSASADSADDADSDWLLGSALLKTGSVAEGLQHLERSAAAVPQDLERQIELAGAYIAAGMQQQAVKVLRAIPANSAVSQRAQALLVLASASGKPRDAAVKEIERLIAVDTSNSSLIASAGSWFVATGDTVRGKQLLMRAIELDSKAIAPRLALAQVEGRTRNTAAAERLLIEVLKLEPKHPGARTALAELAWSTGDRAAARKWLEETIAIDPAVVAARLSLAQMAFLEGDGGRAHSLLKQALDVAKDRKLALTGAGRVLAQAGQTDDALARFREAAAAGHIPAVSEAARLHIQFNQLSEARAIVAEALRANPNWKDGEQLLVTIDAREGQVAHALQRARKLAPDASAADLQIIEGDINLLAAKPAAAVEAYRTAYRLQPSAQVVLKIYSAQRVLQPAAAERGLVQWLQQHPQDSEVRRILAAHYESEGRAAEAASHYELLLAAGRIDPVMLNNLAWSLHMKGDTRALDLAKRAYAEAPHSPEICDTYGWILVQMDKVPAGLGVLEEALQSAPENPDIQYHAAFAYAKSGQNGRALELLHKAVKTQQQFVSRDAAETLLRSLNST